MEHPRDAAVIFNARRVAGGISMIKTDRFSFMGGLYKIPIIIVIASIQLTGFYLATVIFYAPLFGGFC